MYEFQRLTDGRKYGDVEMFDLKLSHPYMVDIFVREFAGKEDRKGKLRVIYRGATMVRATYNMGYPDTDLVIPAKYKNKWIKRVTAGYDKSKKRMNLYIHI